MGHFNTEASGGQGRIIQKQIKSAIGTIKIEKGCTGIRCSPKLFCNSIAYLAGI